MTEPAPQANGQTTGSVRIAQANWAAMRFGWAEAVGNDMSLTLAARYLAYRLAFRWANARTARCDPGFEALGDDLGKSADTVKRAVRELRAAGWISTEGGHNGRNVRFVFLVRGTVSSLSDHPKFAAKGGKYDPLKGGNHAPQPETVGGQICTRRGAKMPPPYNKDEPYKNHRARAGAEARDPGFSENPQVQASAERAAKAWRDGRRDAIASEPRWVQDHIRAAGLLTEAEFHTATRSG